MLEQIESKLKEIADQIEKSAANHNFLLGAKAALETVYNTMKSSAPVAEQVVAAVDPAAAPIVDATVSAVEDVVAAS